MTSISPMRKGLKPLWCWGSARWRVTPAIQRVATPSRRPRLGQPSARGRGQGLRRLQSECEPDSYLSPCPCPALRSAHKSRFVFSSSRCVRWMAAPAVPVGWKPAATMGSVKAHRKSAGGLLWRVVHLQVRPFPRGRCVDAHERREVRPRTSGVTAPPYPSLPRVSNPRAQRAPPSIARIGLN